MTDLQPSPQKLAAETRSRPRQVTGKLRDALLRVVHEAADPYEAATAVGLQTGAMRKALQKRHVLDFLKAQREVLRATAKAQNIRHAIKMRDTSGNAMAQLGAMRFLEQSEEQVIAASRQSAPGIVIMVQGNASIAPQQSPAIDHDMTDSVE